LKKSQIPRASGFKKARRVTHADAHRPADDAGARLDVLHVATETITLTRTFGMKPASREDIIAPAVLERVVVAGNTFMKAGVTPDPDVIKGTTRVAVEWFFAAARAAVFFVPDTTWELVVGKQSCKEDLCFTCFQRLASKKRCRLRGYEAIFIHNWVSSLLNLPAGVKPGTIRHVKNKILLAPVCLSLK
jgi:hypothetical protein